MPVGISDGLQMRRGMGSPCLVGLRESAQVATASTRRQLIRSRTIRDTKSKFRTARLSNNGEFSENLKVDHKLIGSGILL